MPSSPCAISLSEASREELESVSRRGTAPYRMVMRARIVLLAAGGTAKYAIAGQLGICEDTARKWRRRYCEQGRDGLADAPRPGRPRKFPAGVVAGVKALACELPAASGTPLARWSCPELARHAAASGIVAAVSASTVRHWLAGRELCQHGRGDVARDQPRALRQQPAQQPRVPSRPAADIQAGDGAVRQELADRAHWRLVGGAQ